jgi:hypothetical protein
MNGKLTKNHIDGPWMFDSDDGTHYELTVHPHEDDSEPGVYHAVDTNGREWMLVDAEDQPMLFFGWDD